MVEVFARHMWRALPSAPAAYSNTKYTNITGDKKTVDLLCDWAGGGFASPGTAFLVNASKRGSLGRIYAPMRHGYRCSGLEANIRECVNVSINNPTMLVGITCSGEITNFTM